MICQVGKLGGGNNDLLAWIDRGKIYDLLTWIGRKGIYDLLTWIDREEFMICQLG